MSIFLDTTSKSIEVLLSAVSAANNLDITAGWVDHRAGSTTPAPYDTVSNGVTAVTVVAAPAAGVTRQVMSLAVFNADTQLTRVTVRLNNGGVYKNLVVVDLFPLETLHYAANAGFHVCDRSGALKTQERFQRTGSLFNLAHAGGAGITSNFAAGASGSTALTTVTITDNLLMAVPFVAPPRIASINRIGVYVTTGAGASSVVRLGIYKATSDANIYPDALVIDSGPIAITSTNAAAVAAIDVELNPGELYWAVILADIYTSNGVVRALPLAGTYPIFGIAGALSGTAPQIGLSGTLTYGALSATFPAAVAAVTTVVPAIFLRYAA